MNLSINDSSWCLLATRHRGHLRDIYFIMLFVWCFSLFSSFHAVKSSIHGCAHKCYSRDRPEILLVIVNHTETTSNVDRRGFIQLFMHYKIILVCTTTEICPCTNVDLCHIFSLLLLVRMWAYERNSLHVFNHIHPKVPSESKNSAGAILLLMDDFFHPEATEPFLDFPILWEQWICFLSENLKIHNSNVMKIS